MKKFLKEKINKIILVMIIFVLSISNFVFAEEEVDVEHLDINENYIGFMKNFIMELGEYKVTLHDENGNVVWEKYVLPKELQGLSTITRQFYMDGHVNETTTERVIASRRDDTYADIIHSRDTWILQKNDGKIDISDVVLDKGVVYTNNIPFCVKTEDSNGDILPYLNFSEKWSEFTNFDEWKEYNNGENVDKLAEDLGVAEGYVSLDGANRAVKLSEYVKEVSANGTSPSIMMELVTVYPETTEQIYCNDFDTVKAVSEEYSPFQWGSLEGDYLEAVKTETDIGWTTELWESLRLGLLGGKAGLYVYYDVGIMKYEVVNSETRDTGFGNYSMFYNKHIGTSEPKYVNLTYTETTSYSKPYSVDGSYANFIKSEGDMGICYFMGRNSVKSASVTIKDISNIGSELEYDGELEIELESGEKRTYNNATIIWNVYENRYEVWAKVDIGLGTENRIITDHNKYAITIMISAEEVVLKVEQLLASLGFLSAASDENGVYKYGAGLICGGIAGGGERLLIKFHSNLEQIGGVGEIDEEYDLFGTIGSSEYKWRRDGSTVLKFPETYPQSIAEGLETDENGDYFKYSSYTVIPGTSGNIGGGKRFTVNESKKLTADLMNYVSEKQKDVESGEEYAVLILYVDWRNINNVIPSTTGPLVLYEDELSFKYDYNNIGNSDTRKLQGKINNGGIWHK